MPDVFADPDYRSARTDVRSEVAAPVVHLDELLGVVNFEGTLEHPIGPAQVALAEMVCHELSGALRSARLDDERRDRLHATERVLAVSRALVADLDRPRIVASIVDVASRAAGSRRRRPVHPGPDGTYRLESGIGFPPSVLGLEVPAASAWSAGRSRAPSGSSASRRSQPGRRVPRSGPAATRRTRRWPCRSSSATRSPRSCS